MADTKKYYHNLDVDGNMVQNLLLNPLTTTQRLALTLGVSDESYTTFDTDLNTPYYWDGAAWIVGVGSSLPSQTGNAGKWLTTNGTTASWQTLGGNVSLFTNDAGYINLSSLSGGTGISYNNLTGVITNSAPDQTVVINSSTGISIAGGYPTFTITNSAPDQIVSLTGGTGISITGTYPNFTITGTAVGVTSISAGAGMDFATITGTGSVILGTPSNITLSSTNSASGTTHTHAFAPGGTTGQYIRGDGSLATLPSLRFGVSGEDALATQNRYFDINGYTFKVFDNNSYFQFYETGIDAYIDDGSGSPATLSFNTTEFYAHTQTFGGTNAASFSVNQDLVYMYTTGTGVSAGIQCNTSGTVSSNLISMRSSGILKGIYMDTSSNSIKIGFGAGTNDTNFKGIKVDSAQQVYLDTVTNDNTETKLLTWNSTDKKIEYRNVSSLGFGTGTVTSVGLSAGTGISIGGTNPVTTSGTISVTNTAPDQVVVLTAGTATTISGTYPNFTIGASYTPVNQAGDTMTGYLTLVGSPNNPLEAATKEYVDLNVGAGIHIHQPVRVETQGNLTATYTDGGTTPTWTTITSNSTLATGSAHGLITDDVIVFNVTTNGITAGYPYFVYDAPTPTTIRLSLTHAGPPISSLTNGTLLTITSRANSGVGATLVNAGTQVALSIDGIALSVGNRVLVYQQTNAWENGIYDVTSVGSGATNWILTRSANEDTYDPKSTSALGEGDYFFVQEGVTSAGESYVFTTAGTIIFGTTNLVFTQFARSIPYTGGTNIDVTGQVISLTGQVAVANGGTGASTLTGALIGDGTNPVTGITGTAGQVLRRNLADTAYEFYTPSTGGMSRSINSVSINTAAGATSGTDYIYLVTGITTITLPTAVGNTNLYTVKNVGNNTVSIATTGGETIDGSSTITLPVKYTSIDVISDGTNWNII